ncbi:MAG TPA: cytochrome c biogenesis protein CcdA [Bacteroidia bacterium]
MNQIKNLLLLFFGLLFCTIANAQPAEPPPPVFKVTLSNPNPKVGDEVEVILTTAIPPGIHMYSSNNKCEIGPMTFVAVFENLKDYKLIGSLRSIGDKIIKDEVFKCEVGEFFNKAEFRQKIKILKNNFTIKGFVEGQWCSESTCFQIGNPIPNTFSLKVKASGDENSVSDVAIETPAIDSAENTTPVVTNSPVDTASKDTSKCADCSYKQNGPSDNAPCTVKTYEGKTAEAENEGYWGLFLLAFGSGLIGLLTPCVFPMIPMTVSFFMKDDKKSKLKARSTAAFFGFSIVFIYTVLGTLVSFLFGPDAGNIISTHWIPNLLFFAIFIVFAFSFFGAFEIVLPSSIANKADREADKGGYYGAFFMALTLAIVSFSCTGPIVGNVLIQSASGEFLGPAIAMFGFGLAFALPFTLFALFPGWLKSLPKSGGWLNVVKVCIGFLELAFALKFLSTVDLTYHWHLLDREVYLALWIIIFFLMGIYLLGKLKFSHDSDTPFLKVPRLLLAIVTLSFVMYMIPGLWGAPLKFLSGYLPPMSTQDFDVNRSIREANGLDGNVCKKPSYANELHIPHGLNGYFDYEEAMSCGKELKKPVFIDFTGHGCVNCRKMEEKVWSDPRVLKMLREEYVIASLYVDDKKIKLPESEYFYGRYSKRKITTLGKKNTEIQNCYFRVNSQPLYCLMDGKSEQLLQLPVGSVINDKQFSADEFLKFLENGLAEYKLRNTSIK